MTHCTNRNSASLRACYPDRKEKKCIKKNSINNNIKNVLLRRFLFATREMYFLLDVFSFFLLNAT